MITKDELARLGYNESDIDDFFGVTEKTNSAPRFVKPEYTQSDITPISEIKKYSGGEIVELPAFGSGCKFVAKLRRPSLLLMVKSGKIPNTLITQATKLFQSGAGSLGKDNTIGDMYDIMQVICEAALVAPTYSELVENGIELTDEQIMAIFSYTQQGVKALERFRNI